MFGCLFLLQLLQGWKLVRCDLSLITLPTSEHKSCYFFLSRIPRSACDNLTSIPTPSLCLVGQEAEQLRRTVRSLASGPEPGCVARRRDDCVSTCWPLCFLTGDLLNGQWQIYVSCYFSLLQEGIRKTRDSVTMGPPLQASKQTPKVSSTTLRVAQRHIQPVGHKTSRWPCDPVDVGFSEWWLQIWEVGGWGGVWGAGWWGNIEEATLDFWRVRWTLMGRRSRRMRRWWGGRRGTGRRMACGRGHSFDLWFFNFFWLWRLQSIRTAPEGKEGKGWEAKEGYGGVLKWRGGHALVIHDFYD